MLRQEEKGAKGGWGEKGKRNFVEEKIGKLRLLMRQFTRKGKAAKRNWSQVRKREGNHFVRETVASMTRKKTKGSTVRDCDVANLRSRSSTKGKYKVGKKEGM